ncbi:MAG: elongation factor G [Candidatus Sumerlaeota bacterium]|nr:elongation factor G [Candidatus Sumerlaeota bacterium]
MKEYTTENIRTVALCGHMGAGKTSLAEALLFRCKHTDRLGKVDDGNTVSDYDKEEIERKISINAVILPLEYKDIKINMMDVPGYRDFVGEIRNCIRVAESVCLVLDAGSGVEAGAEQVVDYAHEFGVPCFAFINKMDKERANYPQALASIKPTLGIAGIPIALPYGQAESFKGVIDLLKMKLITEDAAGKAMQADIPADMKDEAQEARAALVEAAAEGDDALTDKFLSGEALTEEETLRGLRGITAGGRFIPVLCGAVTRNAGVQAWLDFVKDCAPSPATCKGFNLGGKEPQILPYKPAGPALAFVFKTVVDDFIGRITFFKILRGALTNDSSIENLTKSRHERISHLLSVRGKKPPENVHRMMAGDIGCVTKCDQIDTWDTLGDAASAERVTPTPMPKPTCFRAISAATKGEEEKLGMQYGKLIIQDQTIKVRRDPETHQTVVEGQGETHLDVAVSRLKTTAHIDILSSLPRVAYRETIRKTVSGSYRHKKQSGGRGQFGEVHMRFEPNTTGSGFEFDWEVVGGNIPSNYQGAVEKGIVSSMERGIIAGYQAVDIKAFCFDGKYHDVDSSDMAFQIAARMAFRNITKEGLPVILEPIVNVKVTVPEGNMGDVMGDFSGRRGRVQGSTSLRGKAIVEAQVPMAEMYTYSRELRSMTGGRGSFEMDFSHYEIVPREIQDKLIAAHEKSRTEEE